MYNSYIMYKDKWVIKIPTLPKYNYYLELTKLYTISKLKGLYL